MVISVSLNRFCLGIRCHGTPQCLQAHFSRPGPVLQGPSPNLFARTFQSVCPSHEVPLSLKSRATSSWQPVHVPVTCLLGSGCRLSLCPSLTGYMIFSINETQAVGRGRQSSAESRRKPTSLPQRSRRSISCIQTGAALRTQAQTSKDSEGQKTYNPL